VFAQSRQSLLKFALGGIVLGLGIGASRQKASFHLEKEKLEHSLAVATQAREDTASAASSALLAAADRLEALAIGARSAGDRDALLQEASALALTVEKIRSQSFEAPAAVTDAAPAVSAKQGRCLLLFVWAAAIANCVVVVFFTEPAAEGKKVVW
jgi:hypothetical protein